MYNLEVTTIIVSILSSFIFSKYLMTKGMHLDLKMPSDKKRYKTLTVVHYIPILNTFLMFIYLVVMLHKFKRL